MFKSMTLAKAAAISLAISAIPNLSGAASLGPNPAVAGGTYTSPGGLSVALTVRNIDGKTAVCGVFAKSEKQSVMTRGAEKKVLRRSAVLLGGAPLISNLAFLREVSPSRSYASMDGACRLTKQDWQTGNDRREIDIVMRRQVVYRDLGDDFGGGITIYFRPSGPSAHPDDPKPWSRTQSTNGG